MEKLLVTSNFSFSQSVFYPFQGLSTVFVKFKIVVCKYFEFGKVYNSLFGKGLINQLFPFFRKGLVNASGTKLQVNGAAYGKGIYLSPDISTSMGYSRMGYGYQNLSKKAKPSVPSTRYLDTHDIKCIALCEVITAPNLKKSGSIWVCPDEKHVCTRFFFVYEAGQVGESNINTQNKETLQIIRQTCGYKV